MKKFNLGEYLEKTNLEEMAKETLVGIDGGCTGMYVITCLGSYVFSKQLNPCGSAAAHRALILAAAPTYKAGTYQVIVD